MEDPIKVALVEVGLSSIREPLYVATYGDSGEESCRAHLAVAFSDLPSRRLLPRPRELAEQLVPVVKAFGATTCSIVVWLDDPEADPEINEEVCQRGTFRYEGGSWSTVEDDGPCW